MAKLLIEFGVPVDIKEWNGMTPLHSAIIWNRPKVVALLKSCGASMKARYLGLTCEDYLNPSKKLFTLTYQNRKKYGELYIIILACSS